MDAAPGHAPAPLVVVPSVLAADLARVGEEVRAFEDAGADRIQFDVMDGHFVPNLTFGPGVIAAARSWTSLAFEAHLMVERPDDLLVHYVEAGCEIVIVHAEACTHLHRTLGAIADAGARAGVALNPATPLSAVQHVLGLVSLLLVMTVNPGFGGQQYLASMEEKLAGARSMLDAADHPIDLEVDGGISTRTVAGAVRAGANALVAGSALYRDTQGLAHAVSELRTTAEEARR